MCIIFTNTTLRMQFFSFQQATLCTDHKLTAPVMQLSCQGQPTLLLPTRCELLLSGPVGNLDCGSNQGI